MSDNNRGRFRTLTLLQPDAYNDNSSVSVTPLVFMVVHSFQAMMQREYAIVLITHSMEQTHRIADRTAFFYIGELVEVGKTSEIFEQPQDSRTRSFIEGAFG